MIETGEASVTTWVTNPAGLTESEAADRRARGDDNRSSARTSRTFTQIASANIFTRFNAILGLMFGIIVVIGPIQDGLFVGVLVSNALIGIVQELRAKRTLDRLAVLNAPHACVVRGGEEHDIGVDDVVLDDLLVLRVGDQVPCDGIVRTSTGLELDESLLTGESDPVVKGLNDEVLSGSFVVAGSGQFQATRVGDQAYARKLAIEARRFALTRSELMDGINVILRFVTWALVPVAGFLYWSQFASHDSDVADALRSTIAAIVGMVPQGLVLLTSIAFAVAATTLARRKVLVQELPAVEGLARVDIVCLDKTGTLTEGEVEFAGIEAVADEGGVARAQEALGAMADDPDANATLRAVGEGCAPPVVPWTRIGLVPFSSARKWSSVTFDTHGTWVLGAPEMLWDSIHDTGAIAAARVRATDLAATGKRVLLCARSDEQPIGEELPSALHAIALVTLEEKVRGDARETLAYFTQQGVGLRVISGDNPHTVGAVAARVGLPNAEAIFDARELPEDEAELAELLETHAVFGRVTPHQKRSMVRALQSSGHVVAMTGDGVNDALALKDADIGIAMGSGAAATRAVAQLVLLDGKFARMPGVVSEGRRVISNIERVSNLFLTKTVYSMLLAVVIVITEVVLKEGWQFPLLPRHVTVIGDLTIGIPAFFLSLAPSTARYVPGFISRVLRFAVPGGAIAALTCLLAYGIALDRDLSREQSTTVATLVLLAVSLWVLVLAARPLTPWRVGLVAAVVTAACAVVAIPRAADFFALDAPFAAVGFEAAVLVVLAIFALEVVWWVRRTTAT